MESANNNLENIFLCKDLSQIDKKIEELSGLKVICISFATAQSESVYKWLSKKNKKETIFLAGGSHPSALPHEAIEKGFDYVFKGEGEITFTSFLRSLEKDILPNEKIFHSSIKANLNDYLSFSKKFMRFGPIEITRGCPYACRFCQTSYLFGTSLRHRNIDKILEQVSQMKKLGLNDIRFLTPDALSYGSSDGKTDLKTVEEMLKSVKRSLPENGRIFFGTFPGEIRPERITSKSLAIIKKYCDNKQLTIGAQSASDRMLKHCHRGHDSKQAMSAIEICLKEKFTPVVDFIFGLPEEEEEDVEMNIEFIEKISSMGAIIHTHYFTPLPGTPWAKEKPSKISEKMRLKLKHLENKKLAFGKWEKDCLLKPKF